MSKTNQTIDLLMNHTSVRKFTNEKIDSETLETILLAGQRASTTVNSQLTSVVVVRDKGKLEAFKAISNNADYVVENGAFVVFLADFNKTKYATDSQSVEQKVVKSPEAVIAGAVDCALVAQNVAVAAESLGYHIVFIGSMRSNLEKAIEVLELPKYVIPMFGMCIGKAEVKPEQKPRMHKETFIHYDKYDDSKYKKHIEEYDVASADYLSRNARVGDDIWTKRTARIFGQNYYPTVFATLKKQGFEMSE